MKSYSGWQRDEVFQALGPMMVQFQDDLYQAAIAAATQELRSQLQRKKEVIEVEILERTARAATEAMRAASKRMDQKWIAFDKYIEENYEWLLSIYSG